MSKVKQLSFEGKTINCGLDVHMTNWKVNARMDNLEIDCFSQDPDPVLLAQHFHNLYPGAKLNVAYEAGFCGFGIQRSLTQLGVHCIVANAADVPSSDKDRKRKDDKRDARKLSMELAKGNLQPIYVPDPQMEQARCLVRQRFRVIQDQTRCANRIKHLLLCNGLKVEGKSQGLSLKFIKKLQELQCGSMALKMTLQYALEQYLQIRRIIKDITVSIRQLAREEPFARVQSILQSIDGIGLINGMAIQTEIVDIYRFRTLDSLCDYAGFVPDMYSTNDSMVVCGITSRANQILRKTIIESSWVLIKKDPAMLMKYNEYKRRMNANKAIIRIAKHLLSRIRFLWKNGQTYQRGIVG